MDLLALPRRIFTDKSTIGELLWEGTFFCNTLELSCRKANHEGHMAINSGRYRIRFDYSPHFKMNMPFLFNEFTGRSGTKSESGSPWVRADVMIHPANFPEDLEGCIGVGIHTPDSAADFISDSRKTFERLVSKLKSSANREIWMTISGGIGSDNWTVV